MPKLTHIDENGDARMVDVGEKPVTERRAVARGTVRMSPRAFALLASGDAQKGDVLAAARIAGIMAAKKTPELIPLCHGVALSSVKVDLTLSEQDHTVQIVATARATDRTGVEMEALTAVSVAALTVYDMLKAADRTMSIGGIELLEKSGGRSGSYRRPVTVVPKNTQPATPAPAPDPMDSTSPGRGGNGGARRTVDIPAPSPAAIAMLDQVSELERTDQGLLNYLRRDPIAEAYMLGDLDLPYAEHARWFGLHDPDVGLEAVVLLYDGLSVPAVLTSGGEDEVEAVLASARGRLPRRFYAHARNHHIRPLEVYYDLIDTKDMLRMGLRREDYRPAGDPDGVESLTHRDTASLMKLYQHYPDHFFEPAQLDLGLYFGTRIDGELVSVAGLHVLSEASDVAAIGNIVTHADHRGSGLATRCVRRLLDELFQRVGTVVLNVESGNVPAIACYHKFGFHVAFEFTEGWAALR